MASAEDTVAGTQLGRAFESAGVLLVRMGVGGVRSAPGLVISLSLRAPSWRAESQNYKGSETLAS